MSEYFSTSGTKLSAEMQEAILAATPNMMVIFDDSYHLVGLHNPILEHIPYPPEETTFTNNCKRREREKLPDILTSISRLKIRSTFLMFTRPSFRIIK